MKAVVQRVSAAQAVVDGKRVGAIKAGLLVLLGVEEGDSVEDLKYLYEKVKGLRIFTDEYGKMNLSLIDINGELLVVSQFTLCADCRQGRRPSFTNAARPEIAKQYYEQFLQMAEHDNITVQSGSFGAHMEVTLTNDGPVTIILESKKN